jgi:hypothetical protein
MHVRNCCCWKFTNTLVIQMQVIEGLIISMLKANGPKSADKVHNLLKTVYKSDIVYTYDENQTRETLRNMVTVSLICER